MSSHAAPPVVLVHGWGGSFESTWQRSGFTALLEDAGLDVVGVDLLGHGTAPKPHEPEAYADLTERVQDRLPDLPVDAIGFSLGAMTLLRLAVAQPHRFNRIVLAGIGANIFDRDDSGTKAIVAGLESVAGGGDPSALENTVRLFTQYASQPGNDIAALTAVMKRPPANDITPDTCAMVTCPVLVVVGDQDFVYPGDALAAAFPNGRCETLRNVDHFATTESFGFFDAALEFLDAI
ncbi:MAG TPA: alpha/beta fold hydrolase [Ilumatobacteraceae bacterium]|nr:alpha/beta fold hydrolase [Ilumatobacteraceae bacterium]